MQQFGYNDLYADFRKFHICDDKYVNYAICKEFTKEAATKDNFFMNSICFWKETSYVPKRKPDYTSYTKYGEVSSRYWYTPKGVYRKSNHWGEGVASCDWYWQNSTYKKLFNEIAVYNKQYIGFAKWEDFAAIGYLASRNSDPDDITLIGFEFRT